MGYAPELVEQMIEPGQVSSIRKKLGISQSELARRSGVSQSLIAKIEAGRLDPAFTKARAISSALEALQRSTKGRTASQLMNPKVLCLSFDEKVDVAIASMAELGISQIPIVKDGKVEGTLTESSVMDFVVRTRKNSKALETPVGRLMEGPLPQVRLGAREEDLLMLLKSFPAVLVRENEPILGIITKSDVLSKNATRKG